jgi:hypothetical protein
MTPIRLAKMREKGLRQFGDRSVELHFGFCFQQNVYGGWVAGLKDTGRGPQESPESRVIGKAKPLTTKDTKERKAR